MGVEKRRQWGMFCLSVVDMKSLEEIGRGFYIMKWIVVWKILGYKRVSERLECVTLSMLEGIW